MRVVPLSVTATRPPVVRFGYHAGYQHVLLYTRHGIFVKTFFQIFMPQTIDEKKKLLNRVRRIRGQVDSIERALEEEAECSAVLHNIATCRGAMDGLMAEVIEGHIRYHILNGSQYASDDQKQAAEDLVEALRAYLK